MLSHKKKRNPELITTVEKKEYNQEYAERKIIIESIPSFAR